MDEWHVVARHHVGAILHKAPNPHNDVAFEQKDSRRRFALIRQSPAMKGEAFIATYRFEIRVQMPAKSGNDIAVSGHVHSDLPDRRGAS